ncbi:hypothetical protein CLIB1423_07S00210 [[Candida] railenensis]|uniref:Uncharacterized protein n=1 Tax=[Candida] railenensis TaxID=45579 RepID=A0A9P0QNH0_9ASCO|nr:hypothetical protein CLIB1423_07S00210 [[Candida] railenensis]
MQDYSKDNNRNTADPASPTSFTFGHKRSLSIDFEMSKKQRKDSDCSSNKFSEVFSSPESVASSAFEPIIDLDIITNEECNLERRNSMLLAQQQPLKGLPKYNSEYQLHPMFKPEMSTALSLDKTYPAREESERNMTLQEFLLSCPTSPAPDNQAVPRQSQK